MYTKNNEALDIVHKMDFSIISFGWYIIEPGVIDGYMHSRGEMLQ